MAYLQCPQLPYVQIILYGLLKALCASELLHSSPITTLAGRHDNSSHSADEETETFRLTKLVEEPGLDLSSYSRTKLIAATLCTF